MNNTGIVHKPVITEKSLHDVQQGIYTFEVAGKSAKKEIKKAIEQVFAVHVLSVNTVNIRGKKRTAGKKRYVVTDPKIKKARVTLAKGEKIGLFEESGGK